MSTCTALPQRCETDEPPQPRTSQNSLCLLLLMTAALAYNADTERSNPGGCQWPSMRVHSYTRARATRSGVRARAWASGAGGNSGHTYLGCRRVIRTKSESQPSGASCSRAPKSPRRESSAANCRGSHEYQDSFPSKVCFFLTPRPVQLYQFNRKVSMYPVLIYEVCPAVPFKVSDCHLSKLPELTLELTVF